MPLPLKLLLLLALQSIWSSAACCGNATTAPQLLEGINSRGVGEAVNDVQSKRSPMKSLAASASAAAGAGGHASGNRETSSLGGFEFNTPYSHEIAVLAVVLFLVASVAVVLALKFTQRALAAGHELRGATTEDTTTGVGNESEVDDLETAEPGDEVLGEAARSDESVPIMHRFIFSKPSSNYSYASLLQTDRKRTDEASWDAGLSGSVCKFSARLDEANGLLCLHGFQLCLRAVKGYQHPTLDGWTLAIDIVAQTDVECRQMRLQTKLRRPARDEEASTSEQSDDGADGVWMSEPIDDVLAVRVKQNVANKPLKGRLLIRALALQRSAVNEPQSLKQKQAEATVSSMLKLGGATFLLNRIRRPSMPNLEVTLRGKS